MLLLRCSHKFNKRGKITTHPPHPTTKIRDKKGPQSKKTFSKKGKKGSNVLKVVHKNHFTTLVSVRNIATDKLV